MFQTSELIHLKFNIGFFKFQKGTFYNLYKESFMFDHFGLWRRENSTLVSLYYADLEVHQYTRIGAYTSVSADTGFHLQILITSNLIELKMKVGKLVRNLVIVLRKHY